MHHPDRPVYRPTRCLRHRVWMAACADCRQAHTVVRDRPETTSGTR